MIARKNPLVRDVFLFGFRIVQLQNRFALLASSIDLFDFVISRSKMDSSPSSRPLASFDHHVLQDAIFSLAKAIDPAVALDQGDDRPWEVVVNDVVTFVVQVDAFGSNIGGDQHSHFR